MRLAAKEWMIADLFASLFFLASFQIYSDLLKSSVNLTLFSWMILFLFSVSVYFSLTCMDGCIPAFSAQRSRSTQV